MRCLVVGADGFLGANLCRLLLAKGHDVTGTALNRKGHSSLEALGVVCPVEYGDVTDRAFVERVVNASEAEWVFHLAAVSIVRIAQANPARVYATNVMGTVNVLEACRQAPTIKAVLVASSDKAYGDHGGKPYREDMPLLPVAPYEVSKAAADLIAQSYAATYGMRAIVVRAANLYGPGDLNWSRLVPNSCRLALAGKPPVVHGGAESMQREWLHVEDAAAAYLRLAEVGERGVYNVGSGETATTLYVAEAIARLARGPAPMMRDKANGFQEIPAQELNTSKLRSLNWGPARELRVGLSWTVGWYRSYLHGDRIEVTAFEDTEPHFVWAGPAICPSCERPISECTEAGVCAS